MNRLEHTKSIIQALDEIMKDDQTLLPLQRDVLEQFKADPKNHQTGIFDLATGFGKTCVMSVLMTAYLRNNPKGKVIIAVPTQTLIENEDDGGHLERLKEFFKYFNQRFSSDPLDIGAFYSERKEPEKQVVITTYNSLNNLRKQINPQEVGLLLLDEAHHTITDKRIAAVESFTNAAQYGMTATPFYSPEKSLSMVLGGTIAQVDVKKAIQTGLLSNVKNILMVSDISVDLASELGQKQDYNEEDYEKAIEKALKASSHTKPGNSGNPKNWEEFRKEMAINVAKLYRDYVDENLGPLNGKQCMINCRTQEEARIQAEAINTLFRKEVAGWWTSDSDDKTVLNRFAQKKLNVICQVGKLAEGFDDPDIAVCINYPTASQVLEEQRSGRPLHKVQNTKKEALVIDLCFRHPDYDNEVDAIRQNNQKLFMDILGAPVVRCEEIAGEKQPDREARPVLHKHTTTLPQLHGFHIISNTQELIRLAQEADKLKEERYTQLFRPGMKSSHILAEEFGSDPTTVRPWLEEAYKKKMVFYRSSDVKKEYPLPLVEWVKSHSKECYALHEDPEATKLFVELHPKLLEAQKNKGLLKIRPGMKTSTAFEVNHKTVRPWLEEAFKKKIVFYRTSDVKKEHPIPLVELIISGSKPGYALHEAPEAMEAFKKLHPHLQIGKIRPGMKTSQFFLEEYGVSDTEIRRKLEEFYNKRAFFYLNTDAKKEQPISLVEKVKSYGRICYALHEAPEAMEQFMELCPELQRAKEKKPYPKIREGMLLASALEKRYAGGTSKILRMLEDIYEKGIVFYVKSDIKKEHPLHLVENVRAGRFVTKALHEAPEAVPALESWYEETHGKKLEKRTTSPTLQSRLKVASNQQKPTVNKKSDPHEI